MKAAKILKKTGKIFLITILTVILLLVTVIIVVLNSENTITRLALKEVSTMVGAPVKVDNVSLRLFRDFPYATVEFNGFQLGEFRGMPLDSNFAATNDTIITLRKLYVRLKSKPLLKNKIEIDKIEIEGFSFNYLVNAQGKSNIDFLLESDTTAVEEPVVVDTTASVLDVLLRNLTIRDIRVNFKDESMKAAAQIEIPEMDISAKVLDTYYNGDIRGIIILTNCSYDSTNIHLMQKTTLGFKVRYEDGKVDIDSLSLLSDGLTLKANGSAIIGDSVLLDIGFNLSQLNLKELSKYATPEMLAEFGLKSIKGDLTMDGKVKGYYYDTLLLPSVIANIALKQSAIATADYPEVKHISFNGSVSAPNPNDLTSVKAQFKDFRIATSKSHIDLAFDVTNLDKPSYNVKTSGLVNFDEFASFLPDSTVEYLHGTLGFNLATHGVLPDDIGLNNADYFLDRTSLEIRLRNMSTALDSVDKVNNLSVDFSYKPNRCVTIGNLNMEAPGYNITLKNTALKGKMLGYVRDMDNMGIDIESLFLQMGNNIIEGKAKVEGLVKPHFVVDASMQLDMEEIRPFMPDSLIEHIAGKVDLLLSTYGTVHLDSIDTQIIPIVFEQSKMSAKLKDFSFEMFDDTLVRINKVNCDFTMANDTIKVDNFSGHAHGIDIWANNTEVWNFYKAFMLEKKEFPIIVYTDVKVSHINYAQFEYLTETDTTVPVVVDTSYFPSYIARGTFAAKSLKYEGNFLEDISGKFRVDEFLYVLDSLKLKAFGGSMQMSAVYDTRVDSLEKVLFKIETKEMDIRQMLIDNKNFDQTDFTHENISGKLTSTFDGQLVMQDSIIFEKINVRGYFKLENGGIYNFEPAMGLAKFTNLRELDNIVFRTMESSVFIYKNEIFFPKTSIVSTAIDMSVFGMQSFDDDFEYHFVVHLGDVLLGKSSKLLKDQGMVADGFEGEDKSSRRGLYLVAMDRKGETKYGFDSKSLQRSMSNSIRIKERGLSLVFNPKLANYSTELDRKEYKRKEKDVKVDKDEKVEN